MTSLLWFTRDLRIHDHPALRAALDRSERVVPVLCLDDRLLRRRHASGPRTQFILECLHDLDERLGGTLVIRHGPSERELPALAREAKAGELHFSADSGPFARRRIERGEAVHGLQPLSPSLAERAAPRGDRRAPFVRVASRRHEEGPHPPLAALNLRQEVEDPLPGGETAARERLSRFLRDGVGDYTDNHDALGRDKTSHNRSRLVVGSFLTKDLGIDWRAGERWFMRLLIDGDEANNNGNWQWIASVGVDPQPFFRRIYNPARHMERFDPRGDYVRRYVPELRDVPDEYLSEPWQMPEEVQRQAGCLIGEDYPEPIVDHREAREEAFARYRG